MKDYYQILRLPKDCTRDDILDSYNKLKVLLKSNKEELKFVKEAFENLIDENKRLNYDAKLQQKRANITIGGVQNSSEDKRSPTLIDIDNRIDRKEKSRKNVYYTSNDLSINGLYVYALGRSYELSDYDSSSIRKDDNGGGKFITAGIIFIIIGILTTAFFVGPLFIAWGIYGLLYREYLVVLISDKGDIPIIKGRKGKMKKISKLINTAITQNKFQIN